MVLLTIVPITASIFTGNKLEPIERHVSEENIKFSSVLKDVLNGFSVVKSFQAEREILLSLIHIYSLHIRYFLLTETETKHWTEWKMRRCV